MKAIPGILRRMLFATSLVLAVGPALAAAEIWTYVTRPGDTLIGIAERYLADPRAWPRVRSLNRVSDPYRMQPGTRLKIPFELLRADPVVAEVLMVNGRASRSAGGSDQPLAAGMALNGGDRVQVAAGSNLSLRFPDGTRLLVRESSRFVLTRADRLGDTGMHRILIELGEGAIESTVVPFAAGAGQYEIRSPALRMAVRGTQFRAAAEAAGEARGEVVAGRVEASGGKKVVVLDPGFGTLAAPGAAPQAPRALPPAPSLAGLPTRIERVPLRFAWSAAPAAQGYRAQILDGAGNLRLDAAFTEAAAKWDELPDGRYTLRVRSIAADGLEGLDADHPFTLDARPEPPFASAPTAKAWGDSTKFVWTEAAGIARYHFQLASDAEFNRLLADETALAAASATWALAPGRYYWRVASIDGQGEHGPFGDVVAFEQRPVPASPQAEAPEVDAQQLRFRWREGEPGQRYLLQLAPRADFAELLLERTTDSAEITIERPPAGEYFMRVKAIDPDGFAGPFGTTQRIEVPAAAGRWWLLLLPLLFL